MYVSWTGVKDQDLGAVRSACERAALFSFAAMIPSLGLPFRKIGMRKIRDWSGAKMICCGRGRRCHLGHGCLLVLVLVSSRFFAPPLPVSGASIASSQLLPRFASMVCFCLSVWVVATASFSLFHPGISAARSLILRPWLPQPLVLHAINKHLLWQTGPLPDSQTHPKGYLDMDTNLS